MFAFPLAMHMANELLSLPVAGATLCLGALAVAAAAARARSSLDPRRLPLMGVMGAFVFAAQMINFTLPGMPGTSGHLGGGVLLAILLGPAAGLVTMAAILIVQCLLFQDGGLLALGCNLLNMGVVPCLAGWAAYHIVTGRSGRPWRLYAGAWAGCLAGVAGGAALVPLEAGLSGVLRVPPASFLALITGVHLVIGCVEGLITFAVLAYLRRVRPASLGLCDGPAAPAKAPRAAVLASLLATAFLLAGVVSWFASRAPDGLESCLAGERYGLAHGAVENASPAVAAVEQAQAGYALLPDYSCRAEPLGQTAQADAAGREPKAASAWGRPDGWGTLAGLAGTAVTLGLVYAAARLLKRRRPAIMNS